MATSPVFFPIFICHDCTVNHVTGTWNLDTPSSICARMSAQPLHSQIRCHSASAPPQWKQLLASRPPVKQLLQALTWWFLSSPGHLEPVTYLAFYAFRLFHHISYVRVSCSLQRIFQICASMLSALRTFNSMFSVSFVGPKSLISVESSTMA